MLVKKLRSGFVLLLAVMIVATPTMFLAQGQVQPTHQQDLLDMAERAQQKVESLFEWVEAQQIEDIELQDDMVIYEALFSDGETFLNDARVAFEAEDFESAVENAIEALRVFREVLRSIYTSLEEAGIDAKEVVDYQGFLEAIVRARARIAYLRVLFEDNFEAEALLDEAEEFLVAAEEVYEDDLSKATYNLREANQLISQVHAILKEEAGLSNEWRIFDYCEITRERTRERFRGGRAQGVNVDVFLESLGYQNENQFMETLEGLIQNVKNNSENFKDSLEVLEAIGNMVRQMDGELTQEINQHQNRYGSGGNGAGNFGGQSGGNP